MKTHLNQIRQLLSELEVQADSILIQNSDHGFAAAELPLIIQEIVDDLHPLLTPYETAFYWYAFRHSIVTNGSPLLRISTRGLQGGVVKSFVVRKSL
jgi:hypothetical protein